MVAVYVGVPGVHTGFLRPASGLTTGGGGGGGSGLTLNVQLDVSGTVFGGTPSWTDLSAYALAGFNYDPITVTWGRQDEYGDVTPSQGSCVWNNADGRFTPQRSSSPYYPYLRRRVRRRVTATISSTTVNLLDDYADSLTVVPDKSGPWTVEHDGTDIFGLFGGATAASTNVLVTGTTLRGFLIEEMLLDSPQFLYALQEDEGSTSFADFTGTCPAGVTQDSKYGPGFVDAGQDTSGTFVAGQVVALTNSAYPASVAAPGSFLEFGALPATTTCTLEAWVQMPTVAPPAPVPNVFQQNGFLVGSANLGGSFLNMVVTTNGCVALNVVGAVTEGILTPNGLCDGYIHHLVGTVEADNQTVRLYVDGQLSVSATAGSTFGTFPAISLFSAGYDRTNNRWPFEGGFAFIAGYTHALTATRVFDHYNAGANAFAGERTDTRITRLLSYRTNTGSSLETGLGFMGEQDITGETLQQALLDVAAVEQGVVYADGQGRIVFRNRSHLFNPTPAVTLDCNQGAVDFPTNFRDDTQTMLNDVVITRNGGSDMRYYNAASITQDGEASQTFTIDVDTDTNALQVAAWMVANGVQEQLTATPLQIDLLRAPPAIVLGVLQLRPLDTVQVTNLPSWAPASTMSFLVQGGQFSLAPDAATATLTTTPLPIPVSTWDSAPGWDSGAWAF